MQERLKVLVVEDDVIIGRLIQEYLEAAGHQVIGIEFSGDRALDAISNRRPDLVLLDINIEGSRDGIDVAEVIQEHHQIPFLFLTALSDMATIERAKRSHPCGYIVKPFKESDLLTSIAIGMYNYSRRNRDDAELSLDKVNEIALDGLTEREFELLHDVTQGLTNSQISEKQHLSISTVKWHLQNIYSKLGVKNRTSAVKLVIGA